MNPFRKIIEKNVKEEIAAVIAQAGINSIPLRSDKETFTGTYWVSANMIYFYLTGRHLNHDRENGFLPRNRFFEELDKPELKDTPN